MELVGEERVGNGDWFAVGSWSDDMDVCGTSNADWEVSTIFRSCSPVPIYSMSVFTSTDPGQTHKEYGRLRQQLGSVPWKKQGIGRQCSE